MNDRELTRAAGGAVALLGLLLLALSVYNAYENVAVRGDPVSVSVLEAVLPVAADLALVALGGWLATRDDPGRLGRYVLRWAGGAAAAVAVVAVWNVFLQQHYLTGFQGEYVLAGVLAVTTFVGGLVGVYAARHDRKRREYRRLRDRFVTLFYNVPDAAFGVVGSDPPTVEMVNPAFEEGLGVEERDVTGRPLDALTVARERGDTELPHRTPTREDWAGEEVVVETGGGRRTFVRLDSPIVDRGDIEERYQVYVDVTSERKREERLDVLSRVLRHNLRNKMTIIAGSAQSLRDDPESEHRSHHLAHLADAAEELIAVSERAQEVERAVSTPATHPRPVELRRVVRDAIAAVGDRYPAAEFDTDLAGETWVSASGALGMAVESLVENAVEHNDAPTPRVGVEVTGPEDGFASVAVTDNGPGIRRETYEIVTGERDRSQLDHIEGLGLWLAQWAATDADGELVFEDGEGDGATVRIRLPAATPPEDDAAAVAAGT